MVRGPPRPEAAGRTAAPSWQPRGAEGNVAAAGVTCSRERRDATTGVVVSGTTLHLRGAADRERALDARYLIGNSRTDDADAGRRVERDRAIRPRSNRLRAHRRDRRKPERNLVEIALAASSPSKSTTTRKGGPPSAAWRWSGDRLSSESGGSGPGWRRSRAQRTDSGKRRPPRPTDNVSTTSRPCAVSAGPRAAIARPAPPSPASPSPLRLLAVGAVRRVLPRTSTGRAGPALAVGVVIGAYAITGLLLRPPPPASPPAAAQPAVLIGAIADGRGGFLYPRPLGVGGLIAHAVRAPARAPSSSRLRRIVDLAHGATRARDRPYGLAVWAGLSIGPCRRVIQHGAVTPRSDLRGSAAGRALIALRIRNPSSHKWLEHEPTAIDREAVLPATPGAGVSRLRRLAASSSPPTSTPAASPRSVVSDLRDDGGADPAGGANSRPRRPGPVASAPPGRPAWAWTRSPSPRASGRRRRGLAMGAAFSCSPLALVIVVNQVSRRGRPALGTVTAFFDSARLGAAWPERRWP